MFISDFDVREILASKNELIGVPSSSIFKEFMKTDVDFLEIFIGV